MPGLKEIRQQTDFVQNILRKEAHLAPPEGGRKNRPDIEAARRFKDARKDKAAGGAKVGKRRGLLGKTPKSATPRETILGSRPRTKMA
jgi:hypothetical protein